jgi:hypothetical protein
LPERLSRGLEGEGNWETSLAKIGEGRLNAVVREETPLPAPREGAGDAAGLLRELAAVTPR